MFDDILGDVFGFDKVIEEVNRSDEWDTGEEEAFWSSGKRQDIWSTDRDQAYPV